MKEYIKRIREKLPYTEQRQRSYKIQIIGVLEEKYEPGTKQILQCPVPENFLK